MASVNIVKLVVGDDASFALTLLKDGTTFSIDPGASVQAALVSYDHSRLLMSGVSQSYIDPLSDWDNSIVNVRLEADDTAAITETGSAFVELQVNDGGKLSWFFPVYIFAGHIS